MKWLGRSLSVALVATLLAFASPASPAQAEDGRYYPREGGLFNVPRSTIENQERILDQFLAAINHTKDGETIRFSMFSFDRRDLARALIRAHKRGVRVQILLNDHQVTRAQRILRREIGRDTDRKNFIYECKNGCRSKGENLHSKFYLFTKTGGAKHVVMTGSVNFTTNGARNQFNDLFTVNDKENLFNKFVELFDAMKLDKQQRPGYWVTDIGTTFRLAATPYRNADAKNDPIMEYLDQVKCFGALTGNANNRTIVRVVMHAWNGTRGQYLARKIRRLHRDGCDVRLLYGFGGGLVRSTLKRTTDRGKVPIKSTGYDTDFDGFLDLYTHQKELLISGHFGKERDKTLVVTGSSNWTTQGLRGDEEIFSLNKPGAMRHYLKQFDWIWNERSYVPRWAGGPGPGLEPPEEPVVTGRSASAFGLPIPALLAAVRSTQGGLRGGPAWEND